MGKERGVWGDYVERMHTIKGKMVKHAQDAYARAFVDHWLCSTHMMCTLFEKVGMDDG